MVTFEQEILIMGICGLIFLINIGLGILYQYIKKTVI